MPKVLLVEDEPALGMIVRDSLMVRGFEVLVAENGKEGLDLFRQFSPDLVVADVMMPLMDGFTLAEQIRKEDPAVPIIFLTARSQTMDLVRGFELGGNDYLKKPFSMEELIVRIQALLRRNSNVKKSEPAVFEIGRYQFDPAKQKLRLNGQETQLSHRESELLRLLCLQKNQVLEKAEVLTQLWGNDSFFNGRSLDVFITKLRRYLKEDAQIQIINIRGVGYKLIV